MLNEKSGGTMKIRLIWSISIILVIITLFFLNTRYAETNQVKFIQLATFHTAGGFSRGRIYILKYKETEYLVNTTGGILKVE